MQNTINYQSLQKIKLKYDGEINKGKKVILIIIFSMYQLFLLHKAPNKNMKVTTYISNTVQNIYFHLTPYNQIMIIVSLSEKHKSHGTTIKWTL